MIYVKVRKGQSIDKALSILKKKVKESKLMVELREREFYTKPSVIKKEKKGLSPGWGRGAQVWIVLSILGMVKNFIIG